MSNSGQKMSTSGWCTFALLGGVLVVAFGAFASATPQNKSTATHFQDAKKTASSTLAVQAKAVAAKLKSVDREENSSATALSAVQTASSAELRAARPAAISAANPTETQTLRRARPGTLPSSGATRTAQAGPVSECVHDDGSTENALGLVAGGEIAWIQQCDGGGGAVTLESVSTTWGNVGGANPGVSAGDTARVYVWSDPTQDGDPCDAVLVCETTLTIDGASIATDVFQVIPLDPACGSVDFGAGESFWIGASAVHVAGTFPSPMDTTAPDGGAWLALVVGGVYDPNVIGGQDPCPLEMAAIGFPADWMLRANFLLGTCGEFGCEPGEDTCNCSADCGAETCGNGICCASAGEDCASCPEDCGDCPSCGDGNVDPGEDCDPPGSLCANNEICQGDCTCPAGPGDPACGAGAGDCCSANGTPGCDDEDCCNCICDCDPFCCGNDPAGIGIWDLFCAGDGFVPPCGASNPAGPCTVECSECLPGLCGDGVCDPAEDCCNCEADCGACACGDGTCDGPCEDNANCPADCDPVSECVHDDGSTENALGLIDGGEIAWIQECNGGGGAVTLASISTTWGNVGGANPGVSDGDTARVYVWSDPTQDGDPCDAVLVCETTLTIDGASIATDVFQVIPLDPACGTVDFAAGESFWIGASAVHVAGTFPSPMDETAPDGGAWLALVVGGVYDPNFIGGQDPCPLEMAAIGFPANWLLRANFLLTTCGEFGCEEGENSCNCAADCGACDGTCVLGACCGDGVVEGHEECDFAGCGTCPYDTFPVDGDVGAGDLAFLLGNWGPIPKGANPNVVCLDADPDGGGPAEPDGDIAAFDLANLLGNWGPCPVGFGEDLCVEGDCDASCECVGRGACCGVKGPGTCDELRTADECAIAGGNYVGDDTICADCPHPACANADGDCCEENFTPGCDDPDCCALVCAVAPICCDEFWDSLCAGEAALICAGGCPIPLDDCASPGTITDGDTAYDTTGATTDGSLHAGCQFDGQTYHDIWFNYDATCTGDLTVTTCEDDGGSAIYDTDLVVYDGCFPVIPCPPTDADLLGCNDDSCSVGFHSFLQVAVVANDCYTIRVGGWNDGDQGSGVLHLDCVQETICGDAVCEGAEDCCNCPADCGACVCGDGTCEDCESNDTCPADCDPVSECVHDDGTTENALGLGAGGEIAWIQECDGGGGAVTLESVSTVWGSTLGTEGVSPGDTVRVYVWSDPTQDGDPCDAVLVCETSALADAASIGTDVFQVIPLDPACGSVDFAAFESFFIGASAVHVGGTFPAPMDETAPDGDAWVALVVGGVYDPNVIGGQDPCPLAMDAIGFPADWLLRANFSLGTCGEFGCEAGENSCSCPADCGADGCGNGICCASAGEDCNTCAADCGDCPSCGDGSCNGDEDCASCDQDCGVCVGCDVCFSNCDDITGPGAPCIDNGADDWMSNVTFAGINNSTGTEGCPCSYGNYSALQASVVAGQTYDLTISICSDGFWVQHARAWFDWNGNLDYECDESVYLGSGVDATLTAPVLVPAGTPSGCYSMRVIEEFFDDPGCSAACTGQTFGEAEDYTVCVN